MPLERERAMPDAKKKEKRKRKNGGKKRDVRYTLASPHASTHPRRDSPDGYDVCDTLCVYTQCRTHPYTRQRDFHGVARR